MDRFTKMVEDRGKPRDIGRSAWLPCCIDIGLRRIELFLRNVKETDSRVVGGLDELIAAFALIQVPLHIGLPGSNPHVTNQDVF